MKLHTLTLANFRRFEQLEIPFEGASQMVIIGDNGAGKTAILEAIAKGLSWLVARINRKGGAGVLINDSEILNGKAGASLSLTVQHQGEPYRWSLAKIRKGRKEEDRASHLEPVTRLADHFRTALTNDPAATSLPLIAYYPVERGVLDIPLKIKSHHSFGQLDGFDNAMQNGVDFRRFFEWFREMEDVENENFVNFVKYFNEFAKQSDSGQDHNVPAITVPLPSRAREEPLSSVRQAIHAFTGFTGLRIHRRPRLQMMINKGKQSLEVGQLSQGEKALMALVGDIARRLVMMNPALHDPLQGEGIVLIDEVDLHLHPRWQQTILGQLAKTFPNLQFILTTHSPIVISQEPGLRGFVLSDGALEPMGETYGLDVNLVLLQEMGAEAIRNPVVQSQLDALLDAIQDGKAESARQQLQALRQTLPADHLELAKAALLLRRLELQQRAGTYPVEK
ncbi:MAG: AAA family ATPase [Magnetococcales bacterium]|nr:AAA family ATPase [Magnetococcales bacterium]